MWIVFDIHHALLQVLDTNGVVVVHVFYMKVTFQRMQYHMAIIILNYKCYIVI